MRTNVKPTSKTNFYGVKTVNSKPMESLRRSTLCCLLWEDTFYESGATIAQRIKELVPLCDPDQVADLAIELRKVHKLRHVPLLIVRELARDTRRCAPGLIKNTLYSVIERPDELTEFLSLYWADDKVNNARSRSPLAKQVKTGLAAAFGKFNEYTLAKYNRDGAIKLRDVLFMVHAKPKDESQKDLWNRLIKNELVIPDTWEVALSAGDDKNQTFTRLLKANKLGGLAIIRNLRNMRDANVDKYLVKEALMDKDKMRHVLPFRYIAAAKAVPSWEDIIQDAMLSSLADEKVLTGKTILLLDNSGSMNSQLSAKSDLKRSDAAGALAILLREICEECRIFSFSDLVAEVPPRHGFPLAEAILKAVGIRGTDMGLALREIENLGYKADRLIVISDEESRTGLPLMTCAKRKYMVNIGSSENSIAHGDWIKLTGFSEGLVTYIQVLETESSI